MRSTEIRILLFACLLAGCYDGRYVPDADVPGNDGGVVDSGPLPDGCAPACADRECGPDPSCGASCGACASGVCSADGHCEGVSTDGPVILSYSANVSLLRSDQTLVVTAVVTDPNGVDDLIGGVLLDPTTSASYGAFATSASEGSYSLSLGWSEIDTVRTIDAPQTGASRVFRLRFFDSAGHTAEAEVNVTLRCALDGTIACDGSCVDPRIDADNCGWCGNAVPLDATCDGGSIACNELGFIACDGSCLDPNSDRTHCGTCENACTGAEQCIGGSCQTVTCDLGPENTIARCSDGCTNDGDTWIDCEDYNCCSIVACPLGTACNP